MLFFRPVFVTIILLIIVSAAGSVLAQGPDDRHPDYVPGEILVKFKPQVGSLSVQRSLQAEGVRVLNVSPRSGVMRLQVVPGRENETISRLQDRGGLEYAIPNYRIEALNDPNDVYYQNGTQWAIDIINAPQAWDIHTGSSHVVIAVVDTGMDLDHPDLAAKLWVNGGEIPNNGSDDDGNGYTDDVNGYDFLNLDTIPDDDDHYHGTHVSGIAAAVTNNSLGVAGVSWGAKIMPLKILGAAGGSIADLEEAIYYAVDNGAQVINLSLGAKYSKWPCGWTNVETALNYAVNNNVLVVVASGNDGQNGVNCPGAYDQVMAVGSTTQTDARSSFSNYGPRLDITAPGSSIYSTFPGTYSYLSGTSMATPHVAGLAALIWSMDPTLTATQVRNIIQTTADDLGTAGWDQYFGYGRINAYQALDSLVEIDLLETTGQPLATPVLFLADDVETDPIPAEKTVQVVTSSPEVITWTATISPAVSWLNLTPPPSGQISMSSSDQFMLTASKPVTYGSYSTSLIVTGTTSTGVEVAPVVNEVKFSYVKELKRYYFPLIFK